MLKERQLVIVISNDYLSSLGIIRSLGKTEEYDVDLIAWSMKKSDLEVVSSSKYVNKVIALNSDSSDIDYSEQIISELIKYTENDGIKPVLFPADESSMIVINNNREQLYPLFCLPYFTNKSFGLKYYMDPLVQRKLAEDAGFITQFKWEVKLSEDTIELPSEIVFPCYINSHDCDIELLDEDSIYTDSEQLLTALELQRNATEQVEVCAYTKDKTYFTAAGASLGKNIVLPSVVKDSIMIDDEILLKKIYKRSSYTNLKHKVMDYMEGLDYFGPFIMKLSSVEGNIFFEGLKFYWDVSSFGYTQLEANLPDVYVKMLNSQYVHARDTVVSKGDKHFLIEPLAYEAYLNDKLSYGSLTKRIKKSNILLLNSEDDPEPYTAYMNAISKSLVLKENFDNALSVTCEESGWSIDKAKADIIHANEEYGIGFKEYGMYHIWKYPSEEQKEAYENAVIEYNAKIQKARNEAIEAAMDDMGWSLEEASAKLDHSRELCGITYSLYKENEFWKHNDEEQQNLYDQIIEEQLIHDIIDSRTEQDEDIEYEDGIDNLVVVLSRNYSTGLAVIRSLGAAGYTVDLVASAFKAGKSELAACSKYVRNSVEIVSRKVKGGEDRKLVDALLAYRGKNKVKPILFATDDYTASVMDQNRDELSSIFIMPGIIGQGEGSMTEHMDKTVQGELARKVGLLTPQEWIISLRSSTIVIPEDVVYPCFCKPIESITGYKSEMAKCETAEELLAHLKKLRRKFSNRSVLVQEFLTIDNEIDLGGVCLGSKVIIPAIIRKTKVAQYEKGVTLAGVVAPFEEMGELTEKVVAMLKEFHYFGMFDMEFNIVGDKIYFNEVNLRSGGPNYSYYKSGVNLPKIFVDEAMGKGHSEEDEKVTEYGKDFIYEKVAWDDHIHGFMTQKELDEAIENAAIKLLYNDDDPAPGEYFIKDISEQKKQYKIKSLKKAIKGGFEDSTRSIKREVRNSVKVLKPGLRKVKHTVLSYPQMKPSNARNPKNPKPRVLVAGRNYLSNLCMAKSLGLAGYEVEVLKIFQVRPKKRNVMKMMKPDAYSKYVKAYYVCVSKRKSKRIRNRLIQIADPNNKMLLIPCDDLVAGVVDMYYDTLKEYYILPNVNDTEGEVNRLMEKGVQKELAIKAGLPVVGSCIISSYKGQFYIPPTIKYPCFIKPNVSKNSAKGKMKKCDSYEILLETLTEYASKKDFEMIVEDFVEIEREFSILGVSTKNGAIGPGYFGAVVGGQAEHRGVALTGEVLPVSVEQELIDKCVAFVGSLGFDGLYDVDLIQTKDGKMYFVEVNMRFGASGYAFTECGCNLPGMFADYMIYGTPIDMNAKVEKTGVTFVSEKVLIEEYTNGRITRKEMDELMKSADIHFIKSDSDPNPYKHFVKYFPVAGAMRKALSAREQKK